METNTLTITNTRCLTNLLCEVEEFFTYLNEFLFYFLNGKLTHYVWFAGFAVIQIS